MKTIVPIAQWIECIPPEDKMKVRLLLGTPINQKTIFMKISKIPYYDYLVVLLMPVLATFITIYFQTSLLVSIILFFIVPSVYLTIRDPRFIKKVLITILCSIPFTVIIDYFAIKDGSWWLYTISSIRFFGIPIEDFIWNASWLCFVIIFYEYFIDQSHRVKDSPINKRYKYLIIGWFSALFIFTLLFIFFEKYLVIHYFYIIFTVILGLIPLFLILLKRPSLLYKYSKAMIYFFSISLLHEIAALSANQWYFPGEHFIGWVQLFQFRFPFEEFFLWMILGAACLLAWYEYFVDDTK